MSKTICAAFGLALLLLAHPLAQDRTTFKMVPVGQEAFEVMKSFFGYDADIPLEARVVEQRKQEGYTREKIVFTGKEDRVPGYLGIPSDGTGPRPGILLLHGINSSKDGYWTSTSRLVNKLMASGFAVLTLDAEYHGERAAALDYQPQYQALVATRFFKKSDDMAVETVIDYRRALDYLATRKDIDISRIGAIGYSMGGFNTFSLTAVDARVKAAVACVVPTIEQPYSPKAAYHFAPHIRERPFLLMMGSKDPFYTHEEARQLHDLLGTKTKQLLFFESGHMLPEEWTDRALEWMQKHL